MIPLTDYKWTRKDCICDVPVRITYKGENKRDEVTSTYVHFGGDADKTPKIIKQNIQILGEQEITVEIQRAFSRQYVQWDDAEYLFEHAPESTQMLVNVTLIPLKHLASLNMKDKSIGEYIYLTQKIARETQLHTNK